MWFFCGIAVGDSGDEPQEPHETGDCGIVPVSCPVGRQYCIRICVGQAAAHSHSCRRPTETGRATIPPTRARPEWAGGSLRAPRPVSVKAANVCGGPQTAPRRKATPVRDPLTVTHRVTAICSIRTGLPRGPLLPQGRPRQLRVSTFQIRMEHWHPTGIATPHRFSVSANLPIVDW